MRRFLTSMMLILLCMLLVCGAALAEFESYTVKLDASVGIYKGPGADFGYSRRVGKDGVYTIVEESLDEDGNLWGKLKSGLGWVKLKEYTAVVHEVPYTTSLGAKDDICKGPGYEYGYLRDVGKDGVYTIVEEAIGKDGYLWGKLKSGLGWVRLSDAALETPVDSTGEDSSYRVTLGAWVPIYSDSDAETGVCVGIVGEDGVYTIVRETLDDYGNVWGKLKSGAGWVNLNYVRTMGQPLITVYFADVIDEVEADRCDFTADDAEYSVRLAFRANAPIEDVKLTEIQYAGDTYEELSVLFEGGRMDQGMYFVPRVVFYGDMTTYGLSFIDEMGERRFYAVSLSGMDGSPVMNEYVP